MCMVQRLQVGALPETSHVVCTPRTEINGLSEGLSPVELAVFGGPSHSCSPDRRLSRFRLRQNALYDALGRNREGATMAGLLSNLRNTLIVSFILALVIVAGYYMHDGGAHQVFWQAVFRWLHVLFGILRIR